MLKNLIKFIRELQVSDERRKKRWLFVLSAAAMILITICWLIYLNKVVLDLGAKTEITATNSSSSFWRTFLLGLKILGEQAKTIFREIKDIVFNGREIKIEGFKQN